jgi:squalene cyclase
MRVGDEPIRQARRWILAKGGIANSGTLARFYLAAMNQVPWHATAALPVELTLLPNWFPLNMSPSDLVRFATPDAPSVRAESRMSSRGNSARTPPPAP